MPRGSMRVGEGIWLAGKLPDMEVRGMRSEGGDVQVEEVRVEIATMVGGNAVDLEVF